jgi:hypothetical protein
MPIWGTHTQGGTEKRWSVGDRCSCVVVILVNTYNGLHNDYSNHVGGVLIRSQYVKQQGVDNGYTGGVTFEEHEHQQREDAVIPVVVQAPEKQAEYLEHKERGHQVVLR